MTSKKMISEGKDHIKETLVLAFDLFYRGIQVKATGGPE
jgi:hypothetical protein